MSLWSWRAGLAGVAIVAATAYAAAQMPDHHRMHGPMNPGDSGQQQMMPQHGTQGQMMRGQHGMEGGMGPHGMMMGSEASGQPVMPGQEAFGTIQEIVRILEADPATDWSKVNISALREHLIDMDEVTMRAAAAERALDNGVEITVTGEGRTLEAIKRMVPAHAQRAKPTRLERQNRRGVERRQAYRHQHRRQAGDEAPGARLHGDHGAGIASSAAPSHDGKERVRPLDVFQADSDRRNSPAIP